MTEAPFTSNATTTAIPSNPGLTGKIAVVTGDSQGMATATATALAASGVTVAVVGQHGGQSAK